MAINTTKWTVSNLDPTKVRIYKEITIDLISKGGTDNDANLFMRNSVLSKKGATAGVFGFTASSLRYFQYNNYHAFGCYIDNNNRIEFYRSTINNKQLNFRIVAAGSTVYESADVDNDFGKFEIRVTSANVISAWKWDGIKWVQIGEGQTVELGEKFLFAASCGGEVAKLSLSYCYIKI